jgi:hypothetical protein
MFWNKKTNASYGFTAPEITEDADKKIEVPFPTREVVAGTFTDDACEVGIKRDTTILKFATTVAAASALTLTPDSKLPVGARVIVVCTFGSTKYDITVNTSITLTGVASSTVSYELIYDGSNFIKL